MRHKVNTEIFYLSLRYFTADWLHAQFADFILEVSVINKNEVMVNEEIKEAEAQTTDPAELKKLDNMKKLQEMKKKQLVKN